MMSNGFTRSIRRPVALTALVATAAAAVAAGPAARSAAGSAAAPGRGSLEGVWQTDRYGTIITIDKGRLQAFDTTAISCLPGELSAQQSGPPGPDGAVGFSDDGSPDTPAKTTSRRTAPSSTGRSTPSSRGPAPPDRTPCAA